MGMGLGLFKVYPILRSAAVSHWPCIKTWTISPAEVITPINISRHIPQHPDLEPRRSASWWSAPGYLGAREAATRLWLITTWQCHEWALPPPVFTLLFLLLSGAPLHPAALAAAPPEGYPVLLLSPAFEKSNIGQKVRPNYPGILISAVNAVSLALLSAALFKRYASEHARRGSGTGHVRLTSSCPATLKAFPRLRGSTWAALAPPLLT